MPLAIPAAFSQVRPMTVEELIEHLQRVPAYFSVYFDSETPLVVDDVRVRNYNGGVPGPHLCLTTPYRVPVEEE